MRGIVAAAGYVPYHRLDRAAIGAALGGAAGRGNRAVAGFDEDTSTMGVEAARLVRRAVPAAPVSALWFTTATPAYADKTNATTLHAALRLDRDVIVADAAGAARSATASLRAALRSTEDGVLVVAADVRDGLAGGPDETQGGDAAAAVLIGDGTDAAPVLAELVGLGSASEEFLDRWRTPGDVRSKLWEERFGETRYVPLATAAWQAALKDAGLTPDAVDRVVVAGLHARAVKAAIRKLGTAADAVVDDLTGQIGNPGTAQALLLLAAALESAAPGETIALLHLADGADAFVFRTTDAIAAHRPVRRVADQIATGGPVPYAKFLSWRGRLVAEPPRRPEPARASASAAARREDWKFGFVGSRDATSDALHLPPARVSWANGAIDDMQPAPMADIAATVATFTVDRLAYSPSPPIVFAVLDFDGGGRLPCELTDVDAAAVAIGDRVEMTFRRLSTADGIHNYFWKARPIRTTDAGTDTAGK